MRAAAILHDDDEIRVIHRPGSSPFSLVTFAGLIHRPDGHAFWADQVAAKFDMDALGFMPKRENWYPAAAMARCADLVRRVLKPRAIGYGFSMGGYGALKYGRLLGLTHAFAVSPQVSIDPLDMPEEPTYHRYHRAALHTGMRITSADLPPFAVVAADPYDMADSAHAAALAATGAVHSIILPFTAHGAIWVFAQSDALRQVLDLVLAEDAGALRRFARARRRESAPWFRFVGRTALVHGHAALAERLWQRAVSLGMGPGMLAAERQAALTQFARRRRLRGESEFGPTWQDDPAALARLGHAWLAQGRREDALVLLQRALERDEGAAALHRNVCHLLAQLGRQEEAIAAYWRATLRFPEDAGFALNLGRLLYARRDAAAAALAFRHAVMTAGDALPLRGQALLGLSHALVLLERWPEALRTAREAADTLPALEHAGQWLSRVETLAARSALGA